MGNELRRARAATTVVFFLTGAVYATWASRIPAVQERLQLSPAELGLAVLGLEGGAVVGLPLGGALSARLGSRRSLRLGFALYPPAMFAASLAPGLGWLALTLAVMAAATSVIDVAMNAQGIELERRYGRPVLSSLHAGHSFGVLGGGLAGTAAAAIGLTPVPHFAAGAAVGVTGGVLATAWLVSEDLGDDRRVFTRPRGPLIVLGLVAFCAFGLDGGAYNWSAVHLRRELGASAAVAAAGFSAFSLTLALGRVVADRLIARFGRVRFVQAAGLVTAAGMALAMTASSASVGVAGWALFGAGLAGVAPTVLGAAPGVSDVPAPVAIAAVTTVGYLGSFSAAPAIGGLAQLAGLSAALGLLAAGGLVAGLLARPALGGVPAAATRPAPPPRGRSPAPRAAR